MTGTVLFNDTATTDIYSLSLHDALPISSLQFHATVLLAEPDASAENQQRGEEHPQWERLEHHPRSEEHTSELQSHSDLVCRLLLEKKKALGLEISLLRYANM